MPLYRCITPAGRLTDDVRRAVAAEITRIHVEATGAPAAFAHVMFVDAPAGRHFTAGEIDDRTTLIEGTLRASRPLSTRQTMMRSLADSWSRLTGQPEGEIIVSITERDAGEIMEGGLILPAVGEEAAWLSENHERLTTLAPQLAQAQEAGEERTA
ncbi:tautomerase family protein [Streptomyces rubiginosohelvolus]|uniref:Tautomerase family protein n=1 Tax=Streptomyces rubiginosohelvolus TaxID=67362 RepID=A0ABW6EVD9_9ACTN